MLCSKAVYGMTACAVAVCRLVVSVQELMDVRRQAILHWDTGFGTHKSMFQTNQAHHLLFIAVIPSADFFSSLSTVQFAKIEK